ncbi:hypothetical protein Q7P37_003025 [Cladosporium fusiforme]
MPHKRDIKEAEAPRWSLDIHPVLQLGERDLRRHKCFPFANDAMEELALDPNIRNATRNILGGSRRDAKTVEVGYLASKQRTHHALQDAWQKSYGIREEHRVTWAVFQGLQDRLSLEDTQQPAMLLTECQSYAWVVKTEVFIDFLWRSVDNRRDFTTWEQTKIMAMFLRCLRYVCGGHLLEQEGALWHSKREKMAGEAPRLRLWYGLGFKNTLAVYKYCWLEPRIDWNIIQFKSDVTDNVLFGNKTLQGEYMRLGRQAKGFFDISRQLELALNWIGTYPNNERLCDRLVSWLVHICLVQFRLDVISAVKVEVKPEEREEALKGQTGLSYEYINQIMSEGCYLMSGKKTDFKQVSKLSHFLFDFDDSRVFQARFWELLYKYHWVLPYPCGNALSQTTKAGRRMSYSVQQSKNEEAEGEKWVWAKKGWEAGRPREFQGGRSGAKKNGSTIFGPAGGIDGGEGQEKAKDTEDDSGGLGVWMGGGDDIPQEPCGWGWTPWRQSGLSAREWASRLRGDCGVQARAGTETLASQTSGESRDENVTKGQGAVGRKGAGRRPWTVTGMPFVFLCCFGHARVLWFGVASDHHVDVHDATANITPRGTATEIHHDSDPYTSTACGLSDVKSDQPMKLWLLWKASENRRLSTCYLERLSPCGYLIQHAGESLMLPANVPHAALSLTSHFLYGQTFHVQSRANDPTTFELELNAHTAPDEAMQRVLTCYKEGLEDPNPRIHSIHIDRLICTMSAERIIMRQIGKESILWIM